MFKYCPALGLECTRLLLTLELISILSHPVRKTGHFCQVVVDCASSGILTPDANTVMSST